MVEENNKEEPTEKPEVIVNNDSADIFNRMSEITPLREGDDIPDEEESEDENGDHATLEERMDSARKLTDLQVADQRLNPATGFRHLDIIQMSRVFPDIYNPLFRILVKDLIRNSKLSVAEAIAYVNTSTSIAIDGEGRLDEITIARGHIAQAEEEKNKQLGMA